MSTLHMLRALVDQRLTAAVEEIFVVLERTIAEYEAELSRTKAENYQLLDAVSKKHQVVLHRTDVQQPPHIKYDEEDPQPPHMKEEEKEVWISQEGECVVGQEEDDVSKFPLTVVSVKTEEHEDKAPESSQLHHSPNVQRVSAGSHEEEWHTSVGQKELQAPSHIKEEQLHDEDEAQSLQLHHSQSEENRGAELVSQHITEADGEHCEDIKSEPDSIFAPLSDMDHMMSHSSDHSDHIQKPLESQNDSKGDTRHHTNNKHFDCSQCGKYFKKKSNFTEHMRKHTGEKPFTCSVCKKSFSTKLNMTTHMRTHTGEKPFACSGCAKRFNTKKDMTRHMRTHTGEKPFTCSVCKKSFSTKEHMTRHMRTHTGEKPFICSVCKRSFSTKQVMTTHMRTHTGEKPFSCTVCDKMFMFK
ncbi:zinc finger protein OZF-like isoform X9 [Entelurus aequoreus]|uniref:zinc finger protein OZF-like isoform X9 n=1 Tax=Entelurus aequoreus TaxID=161455 RepID=UPI002B1E3294|nr:zinc finger protein OZF-like isoform X9 [Entelurus aequoreus]